MSRTLGAIALAALVLGGGFAGSAATRDVECGDVITEDTKLVSDVGPCPDGGLVVGASHITLDLNGHTVFGTTDTGDGVGISIFGWTGVTVTRGTVRRFDAGVYIESGGHHDVSHLIVEDNVSSSQSRLSPGGILSFGDGIALNSDSNLIRHNVVRHNGPNDGIGVFANSGGNTIRGNVVTDNAIGAGLQVNFDDGIRLESGAHDNLVVSNVVERNGRTGIAVFAYGTGNVVRGNLVKANGFSEEDAPGGVGNGHGIRLYLGAAGTLVRNNEVFGNSADGIRVDARSSVIVGNRTGETGRAGRATTCTTVTRAHRATPTSGRPTRSIPRSPTA